MMDAMESLGGFYGGVPVRRQDAYGFPSVFRPSRRSKPRVSEKELYSLSPTQKPPTRNAICRVHFCSNEISRGYSAPVPKLCS